MNSKKRGGYSGGGGGGIGSQTKRPRQDEDEDAPGSFEQYLATMEDDDMEYDDSPAGVDGQGPEQESTYDRLGIRLVSIVPDPYNLNIEPDPRIQIIKKSDPDSI